MVFLYHYQLPYFGYPDWLPEVAKFGWTGVDLFFVLSGFLISSQLFEQIKANQKISLKDFFIKRFFRILPAYWTVVLIYFCFTYFHEREALPPLWKFLTFTQNFGMNINLYGTFSHAWSLCVEEHFYFLLPITLYFMLSIKQFKWSIWLLIGLFLFGFVIRYYSWNSLYNPTGLWYKYIYYPTYNRLDGLLIGVSIAAIYQFRPKVWAKISQYGNLIAILGLAILMAAAILFYDERSFEASIFGFPMISVGFGFLLIGAVSPNTVLSSWDSKITSFIATLSYGIYLIHKGIVHMTQNFLSGFSIEPKSNFMILLCIGTTIIGALLLRLIIEKPFMKLRSKLL
ncbi:MAG: acyltransferase [Bacteroidales bacterium]|nr:acyltransferase [Bacteroidales bacterium]